MRSRLVGGGGGSPGKLRQVIAMHEPIGKLGMISFVVAASMLWASPGNCLPPARDLERAVESVLRCASERSIECLSRQALNPDQVYVIEDGARVFDPYVIEDAFSAQSSISLYRVASERVTFSYKAFEVDPTHYEVIFYRVDEFSADTSFHGFWSKPSTILQCGFVQTREGWRLTDSICGYVDDD
jgi:hypothetical protein